MELGGNAPLVVTEDADLDAAVAGAMIAKFRGGGQACTAANRLYVHADVAEEFTAKLGAEVEKLERRAGDRGLADRSADLRQGRRRGHRTGRLGTSPPAPGSPTGRPSPTARATTSRRPCSSTCRADADIVTKEIFGPVAPIVTWTDEAEMLRLVNASEFGLAAYVFAGELQRAMRIGEAIDAGMIGINRGLVSDPSAPFGGMKQSGLGREGARAGLEEFTETQYLSIDWP